MNKKRLLLLTCAVAFCFVAKAQSSSIVAMEYWIDQNIANRQTFASVPLEINISDLSPGFHNISVRSQDNTGMWSGVTTRSFVIARPTTIASSITNMEYWFDGKISEFQAFTKNVAEINIEALSPGFHSISVRSKDDTGLWSSVQTKYFIIPRIVETATITHYCYWFDDNKENTTIQASTNPINLLEVNLSGLSYYTEHTLYLAVCDSKGTYSSVLEEIFIIEPITTNVSNASQEEVQNADWYSLDGKKLDSRPTEKGIYIRNGKKIIVR